MTWTSDAPPPARVDGSLLLAGLRGGTLAVVTFGGLALLLILRVIEWPLCHPRRPITPWITQAVCRTAFRILGIGYRVEGAPMREPGAVVANHSSWLDIFALNACQRIYFVSKAEVRDWPGIGWLARATGTVFIDRDRREAPRQVRLFEDRLRAGHRLVVFPEGTSTDGRQVLPFKPTLFAAFLAAPLRQKLWIQPVSVIYSAAPGDDPRRYGWWGDMAFGPHLLTVLAARRQGAVTVVFHPPLHVAAHPDRKVLARLAEVRVRDGVEARLTPRPELP